MQNAKPRFRYFKFGLAKSDFSLIPSALDKQADLSSYLQVRLTLRILAIIGTCLM